ncbi:MAG: hypothetical protein U0794_02620 [Isosphaeraceae bacterium]
MMRRSFIAATVVSLALAGSTARAQANRGVNPLHYNNPLNQAGMYNSSPVLRYNNPLNQAGMYNNVPVLRYNNPIVQGNMYGNGGVNYGGNQSLFTGRSNGIRSNGVGSFVGGQTFGAARGQSFGAVGGTFGTEFFGPGVAGSPRCSPIAVLVSGE